MNRIILIALVFGLISCSKSSDSILQETLINMNSEEVMRYSVDQLIIEGNIVGDTIFIASRCLFQKLPSDSLIGYKYSVENKLIHPRFKIPMTQLYYYNGAKHVWNLYSEVKKDRRITEKVNVSITQLEHDTYGQLPMLVDMLNSCGFNLLSKKDTIVSSVSYIQFSTISDKGIPYNLFIDKKTSLPKLLRIVENPEQPYILEYNYSDFEKCDSFEEILLDNPTEKPKKVEVLKVGDNIPNWEFETTEGNRVSISENKGQIKILFLSTIHCAPCQKAIPMMKRFHKESVVNRNIDCVVFYPDDEKEALLDYVEKKGIDYPLAFYPGKDGKQRYALREKIMYGFPTTLILNSRNEIVWIRIGFHKDLEKEIDIVLKNQPITRAHK